MTFTSPDLSKAMIAVERIPDSDPASCTIDFLDPDLAITGDQVPVTVNQELLLSSWYTIATVREPLPSFGHLMEQQTVRFSHSMPFA